MISRRNLAKALRHPLVTLLVTAAISGVLIPFVTQDWQDYQRKAAVKAQLITDAGKAIAAILTAQQFSEFGGYSRNDDEMTRTFKEWEIEQIVVSSRIRAYLTDPTLPAEWDRFGNALTLMYTSRRQSNSRKESLASLHEYLSGSEVNWTSLEAGYSNDPQFREYNRAWFELKEAMLNRCGQLANRILDAKSR
jgi:hypothetical protein